MKAVYFIRCAGRIKVGYSARLENRIAFFRSIYFDDVTVIGTIEGDRTVETAIHRRLRPHLIKNEWFHDCEEVRAAVADIIQNGIEVKRDPVTSRAARPVEEPEDEKWRQELRRITVLARQVSEVNTLMFECGILRRSHMQEFKSLTDEIGWVLTDLENVGDDDAKLSLAKSRIEDCERDVRRRLDDLVTDAERGSASNPALTEKIALLAKQNPDLCWRPKVFQPLSGA